MRPIEERHAVWQLADAGLNKSDIARRTGVPRATVRDWLTARVAPRTATASCARCGHDQHKFDLLPNSDYAYLLGFYLGDGAISAGPKEVYSLRIICDSRYPGVIAECALATAVVAPTSRARIRKVKGQGCVEIKSYSKA